MKVAIEINNEIISSVVDQEKQTNTVLAMMIAELDLIKLQLLTRLADCETLMESD